MNANIQIHIRFINWYYIIIIKSNICCGSADAKKEMTVDRSIEYIYYIHIRTYTHTHMWPYKFNSRLLANIRCLVILLWALIYVFDEYLYTMISIISRKYSVLVTHNLVLCISSYLFIYIIYMFIYMKSVRSDYLRYK